MSTRPDLGRPIEAYLADLVARVDAHLGTRLVGVWLFGSAALGDFDARRSDLDIQAVSSVEIPASERAQLAAALSHEALPCPARGLEFVLYAQEHLRAERGPALQLNLNTGPGMTHRVSYAADAEPRFWFVLDVAIGREHARALAGPTASEVLPLLPRRLISAALREALAWQQDNDSTGAQIVLAACRAWAWAVAGRWLSKGEAAAWAYERLKNPAPVRLALARRDDPTGPSLIASDVQVVTKHAERALDQVNAPANPTKTQDGTSETNEVRSGGAHPVTTP